MDPALGSCWEAGAGDEVNSAFGVWGAVPETRGATDVLEDAEGVGLKAEAYGLPSRDHAVCMGESHAYREASSFVENYDAELGSLFRRVCDSLEQGRAGIFPGESLHFFSIGFGFGCWFFLSVFEPF